MGLAMARDYGIYDAFEGRVGSAHGDEVPKHAPQGGGGHGDRGPNQGGLPGGNDPGESTAHGRNGGVHLAGQAGNDGFVIPMDAVQWGVQGKVREGRLRVPVRAVGW